MTRTVRSILVVLALSLLTASARADVAPPETEACNSKSIGDSCVFKTRPGTCQNETCAKSDYAHWDRNVSPFPPSTNYSCVMCVTSTNTATGTGTDTGTGTATHTNPDAGDSPSEGDSGCSVTNLSAKRAAPWLMASAFSLLFLFARRRPR